MDDFTRAVSNTNSMIVLACLAAFIVVAFVQARVRRWYYGDALRQAARIEVIITNKDGTQISGVVERDQLDRSELADLLKFTGRATRARAGAATPAE